MTNTDQKAREIAKYATGWMHPNDSDEVIQQMEDGITERIVALLSRPTPTPERDEVERARMAIARCFTAMPQRMAQAPVYCGANKVGTLWPFAEELALAAIAAIPPPIPDRE
jgi:hypothetical protein